VNSTQAKQVVYRYNGVASSEEVEVDADGTVQVPDKDSIVTRNGSRWKVVQTNLQFNVSGSKELPILRVFLTDKL
jgi:hypothetical protein